MFQIYQMPRCLEGEDESGNITLRECGSPRVFDFKPLDHVDLGDGKGLDFETAVKVSGSRYVIMTGELAKLVESADSIYARYSYISAWLY